MEISNFDILFVKGSDSNTSQLNASKEHYEYGKDGFNSRFENERELLEMLNMRAEIQNIEEDLKNIDQNYESKDNSSNKSNVDISEIKPCVKVTPDMIESVKESQVFDEVNEKEIRVNLIEVEKNGNVYSKKNLDTYENMSDDEEEPKQLNITAKIKDSKDISSSSPSMEIYPKYMKTSLKFENCFKKKDDQIKNKDMSSTDMTDSFSKIPLSVVTQKLNEKKNLQKKDEFSKKNLKLNLNEKNHNLQDAVDTLSRPNTTRSNYNENGHKSNSRKANNLISKSPIKKSFEKSRSNINAKQQFSTSVNKKPCTTENSNQNANNRQKGCITSRDIHIKVKNPLTCIEKLNITPKNKHLEPLISSTTNLKESTYTPRGKNKIILNISKRNVQKEISQQLEKSRNYNNKQDIATTEENFKNNDFVNKAKMLLQHSDNHIPSASNLKSVTEKLIHQSAEDSGQTHNLQNAQCLKESI